MLTDNQLDVIRATVVRVAAGYMDHPDAAMMARDVIKALAPAPDGPPHHTCCETTNHQDLARGVRTYVCGEGCPAPARASESLLLPAVGLPTDERALHDRLQTGCLLRRGELCPCPNGEYAYDHCERIKVVG